MGHRVSFLSNTRNIDRLPTVPHDLRSHINLVKLTPTPIDGLPEDAQSTVDVYLDHCHYLLELLDGLEGPLSEFLDGDPTPDWIIYDVFVYWAPHVTAKYGIHTVFFGSLNAMTLSMMDPPSVLMDPQPRTPEQLSEPPPWVPFPTNGGHRYYEAVQREDRKYPYIRFVSDRWIQNGDYTPRMPCLGNTKLRGIRTRLDPTPGRASRETCFPIGLLSPPIPEINGRQHDTWLDTQKWRSTVYIAFGSEFQLSREQMNELAIGLKVSELPLFWAYRGDPRLLPIGFDERIKGRGFVRLGWAPQARLLAHVSIGCFLTHEGWGSTIEGLAFGKPLIMLSMFGDQGLNSGVME